jgi:hypothetical protein
VDTLIAAVISNSNAPEIEGGHRKAARQGLFLKKTQRTPGAQQKTAPKIRQTGFSRSCAPRGAKKQPVKGCFSKKRNARPAYNKSSA